MPVFFTLQLKINRHTKQQNLTKFLILNSAIFPKKYPYCLPEFRHKKPVLPCNKKPSEEQASLESC